VENRVTYTGEFGELVIETTAIDENLGGPFSEPAPGWIACYLNGEPIGQEQLQELVERYNIPV
jgi:hypothetical protein